MNWRATLNKTSFRAICIAGTLSVLFTGALRAETNSKPLFSSSDISDLDQILARAKAGDRAKTTQALTSIFAAKAVANLEDKIQRDIATGAPKTPFSPDKTAQGKRLIESLGEERFERVRQYFQENLDSKSIAEKRSAMWWFLLIDPDSTAKSKVISQLKSKDADVRVVAARQLAILSKDPSGESILEPELKSSQISRALLSAEALGKLKNEKARAKAMEIYNSTGTHAMYRASAISILSEFQSPETEQLLVKALDDASPRVVTAALGRLQAKSYPLSQHAIERLFQIVDDKTVEASSKMMVVWALQASKNKERSDDELRQEFAARLRSDDLGIAAVAVTGLLSFGNKTNVRQLVPLLDNPSDALKAHVERTLGKLTGVRFDRDERDVKVVVAKRKAWWAQHSNDSEYR